jgi:hypothetical protein
MFDTSLGFIGKEDIATTFPVLEVKLRVGFYHGYLASTDWYHLV